MNVLIYARVSTNDKDQNPERQILKCKQYCELHNHNIIDVLQEHCSGDSDLFKRVEGSKISSMDIQGIVIFSMDRLTRQHPVKVIRFINELKDKGIKVISITEPAFNMESDFSDLLLYVMTWFNNYFLTKLKNDVKAGIERARSQGKTLGRPKAKFNKFRAKELLFKEGLDQRAVAKELNTSVSTINRFKKGIEKKEREYINKPSFSKSLDFETRKEGLK